MKINIESEAFKLGYSDAEKYKSDNIYKQWTQEWFEYTAGHHKSTDDFIELHQI